MSGIVGILNLDGAPVDRDLLGRMTEFLSFRGPDTKDIWIDGNVALGHTMLRTTFEAETEKQPLTLDGKVWLTADARIDDRANLVAKIERKLRERLQAPVSSNDGSSSRVLNDAELILYAYEAWGEECVKHLLGDFAFAIWDSRQRRLFCARDHFGVKQFYYAQNGRTFIFTNTLDCLRLHPAVSDELNEVAIGDYLLFGLNQDLSSTAFRDIQRLPQASYLTQSKNDQKIQQFWTAPTNQQTHFRNSADYVERFKELFWNAVGDRLRTNKIAISMSGGLDSTSVAAVASELLQNSFPEAKLKGYAVVYDRLIPDEERKFSTLAASALNLPISHLAADDFSLFEERRDGELRRPEPFLVNSDSALFNELLRSMNEHSRVALSGWDGDAFMNEPPNSYFAQLAKNLEIKKLVTGLGWFVWSRHQLPPIGVRTRIKRWLGKHPRKLFPPEWIDKSFSQRVGLPERWQKFTSESAGGHPTRPYAFRMLNLSTWAPLFESYDAGFTQKAFEVRHPIIDVRLVEYLLSIPPVPWCVNKEIMRVAMAGKLPSAVLDRPKTPLAGFPSLYHVGKSSVRFVDNFEPVPSLTKFVNLSARPRITDERDPDRLASNLRPFSLNHWLRHSL